jgi:N-acetyl-anhydromuramyl-L-alanine amidase AmpD
LKTEIIGIHSHPARNSRPSSGRAGDGRANNDRASIDRATARKKSADPAQLFSKAVEHYAMYFDRPEARLRFLNNTRTKQVERQAKLQQSLRRFRFLKNTRLYAWLLEARCYSAILEELRAMAPSLPKNRRNLAQRIQAPFSARLFFLFHQSRHAFYGATVIIAGLMLFGVYSLVTWSARRLLPQMGRNNQPPIFVVPAGAAPSDPAATIPAKYLPFKPETIWKYETKGGYEKWSNGCRISTEYEIDNRPRAYYTIPRGVETDGDQFSDKIVGIIYHTPESGIVPFVPDNNETIQKNSRWLLETVRERKLYNYMIDRYGDIYRIVRDGHAADHAGYSIWADAKNTYVSLNDSFIGVCFESKFDGTETLDEILTPAQINAGRLLTDVLRTKYSIDDANCTTHGLVAVDHEKMLIARHHDWVRNFPFEAMGLSDKYKIHPPSMSDYGCTYDVDVLAKLGNKLWEGALTAEEEFKRRAEKARVSPDDLRRKLQARYNSQCAKARALRAGPGEANNPQLAEKPFGAGEPTESGND